MKKAVSSNEQISLFAPFSACTMRLLIFPVICLVIIYSINAEEDCDTPRKPAPWCREKCRKPHEVCGNVDFGSCDDTCKSYIERLNKKVTCRKIYRIDCTCKKGYVKNEKGDCISEQKCKLNDDPLDESKHNFEKKL